MCYVFLCVPFSSSCLHTKYNDRKCSLYFKNKEIRLPYFITFYKYILFVYFKDHWDQNVVKLSFQVLSNLKKTIQVDLIITNFRKFQTPNIFSIII